MINALCVSLATTAGTPTLSLSPGTYRAEELTEVQASETAGSTNVDYDTGISWDHYLWGLSATQGGPISTVTLAKIRELWGIIERCEKHARYPHAAVTQDGTFFMTWDRGRHHFEIEVDNSGTYGWFYMDRESPDRGGEEDLYLGAYSPKMIGFLQRAIGEEKWT